MGPATYRTALITGASSGIGAAVARKLASEGTEVVISARRENMLRNEAKSIAELGGTAHIAVMDLSQPRDVERAVRALDEKFGFDLVIANAAVGKLIAGPELSWEACEEMIAVNVSGTLATLVGAIPGMLARGHGHLVGVSSIGQGLGMPENGTYLATKSFLATFLSSLRVDLETAGIFVTDIRPGIVDTPMSASVANRPFVISADEAAEAIVSGIRKREAVVSFPYSAQLMATSMRMMPDRMFRSIVRWMRNS